jgi:hypothetical protein
MLHRVRLGVVVCVLGFVSVPGALSGRQLASPAVDTADHNFGSVIQGEVVEHTFTITNTAPTPMVIQRVDLSHRGMNARFRRDVAPGDEAILTVTWNTSSIVGDVEGQAQVRWSDDARPPMTLTLSGSVTPVVEISPLPAAYFSTYQDEGMVRTLTITNRDDVPLHIDRLEPVGTHFSTELSTIDPGQEYELTVTVAPNTELGRFMERVILHTDHPTVPEIEVGVNVLVKADLYVNPERVEFGLIPLAELRRFPERALLMTQTVVLNRRDGPFEIESATSDVPGLQITQDPTGRSQIFRLDIGIDPALLQPGTLDGQIRLTTSDPQFPEIILPVQGMIP